MIGIAIFNVCMFLWLMFLLFLRFISLFLCLLFYVLSILWGSVYSSCSKFFVTLCNLFYLLESIYLTSTLFYSNHYLAL